MDGDSGIDPRLRDSIQSSQPAQEYPAAAVTTADPARLPPTTSQAPYQSLQNPAQQPQAYPPWPQDAGYQQYYSQHAGAQQPPATASTGYQPSSIPAGAGPSAPQYVGSRIIETKRLRACEACRGLKVRCEPDPNGGPCKRCLKAGRHCMITAPSRKRQKKTDSRVAELEKRIDALTATLHTKDQENAPGADAERYGEEDTMQYEMANHQHGMHSGAYHPHQPYATAGPPPSQSTTGDKHHLENKNNDTYDSLSPVINFFQKHQYPQPSHLGYSPMLHRVAALRDSIDTKLATSLFDRYAIDMVPQMPIVTFPPSSSVETLRKDKPCLFGVIMCVASADNVADLHRTIVNSVLQDVAVQVFDGHATLELVQSLLVLAVWHWLENQRPMSALYAQNAAAMAIINGMNDHSSLDLETIDGLERGRAWLGCYFLLSIAQMGCQNTMVHGIDKGLGKVVESLRSSAIASQHDRNLCEMVSQQRQLHSIFLSDTSPQSTYQILDSSAGKDDHNSFVTLSQSLSRLYALEAARIAEHNNPPNKPPRGRGRPKADSNLPDNTNNKATEQSLACAHSILDQLSNLPTAQLRCLPSFRIIQLAHLSIFLLRLGLHGPEPSSSPAVDPTSIRTAIAIQRLSDALAACTKDSSSSAPSARIARLVRFLDLACTHFDKIVRARNQNKTSSASAGGTDPQQQQHEADTSPSAAVSAVIDDAAPDTTNTDKDKDKHNQALHLLSEVATGNRDAPPPPAPSTDTIRTTTDDHLALSSSKGKGKSSENIQLSLLQSLLGMTPPPEDEANDGNGGAGGLGAGPGKKNEAGRIDDAVIGALLGVIGAE